MSLGTPVGQWERGFWCGALTVIVALGGLVALGEILKPVIDVVRCYW